ncbi:MAG: GNAT family N-acetyltransferase [Erysipelotrichaceae bacterium]|nr:GNAT family N-acetyltransferase [Erysipelotrichaceae bacterium]
MKFRIAERKDVSLILDFIRQLAEYENLLDQVVADEEILEKWIFDNKKAEVIFVLNDENKEVGFVLFFHNFSTFLGKSGLYLEDLFVLKEYRHQGYGIGLIKELARIAKERDCGRFEWWCLNDNLPSIEFYNALGAEAMSEWTTFRLNEEGISKLLESDLKSEYEV